MAKFKKGDAVVQVVKPIEGTVTGYSVDQETGDTQIKVEWTDEAGEHARFFTEADLEAATVVTA